MEWKNYKDLISNLLEKLTFDEEILKVLKQSITDNKKIFIIGNGGSSATASHYSSDFSKGAVKNWLNNKNRYKVIPLTANIPYILAIANDTDYSEIFKQQLINLAEKGDILIAISGSGNSKNIIKAIEYANEIQMITIGITGFDGGKVKRISHYNVWINSDCMEAVEDIHSIFGHFLAVYLRESI